MTNSGRSGYRIRNWDKFQHYKSETRKRPGWIKLYKTLMHDREFYELDGKILRFLILFWLLASDDDGYLPTIKDTAFILHSTEKEIRSALSSLSHWLEVADSEQQAEGLPAAIPDKDKIKTVDKEPFKIPLGVNVEVWAAFEEHRKKLRKPMTDHARDLIVKELEKLGGDPNALLDQSIRKGWQDVFPLKETVPLPASVAELIDKKPEHLCIFDGCDKIGIIGRGKRMYCRKHNPAEPGDPF